MSTAQRHALISFGAFQVDVESGELRKFGVRLKLQSQPFRALVLLLNRPGEVIGREELQLAIWGTNTSVDFERGLASAINKLREALGDSADNPRYIETLAKRGYRFIAPVTLETPASPTAIASVPAEVLSVPVRVPTPVITETGNDLHASDQPSSLIPPTRPSASTRPSEPPRPRRWAIAATLGLGSIGAVLLLALWVMRPSHVVRPPQIAQVTLSSEVFAGLPNFENLPVLVTDGPRVYTSTLTAGHPQISSIELSEPRMQSVSIPDEISPVSLADISPDGSKLLLRSSRSRESEQPLWIVPTSGSSALRVGDVLAHDATWMPGGKGVLYAAGDQLGVVQLDTGMATVMTSVPGRAFWPRWSRDGGSLRFTLVNPSTHASELWELETANHHLHRLEFSGLQGLALCCGSWMADGKKYVFEASSPHESNLWAVDTGALPTLTELTNGPLRYLSPLPARDEQRVYFIGLEQPAGTRLFDHKAQSFVPGPPYLADAQRITYSRTGEWVAWTDRDSRLWRARSSDGSGRIQLTPNDMEVFLAQWSPDGKRLVLMARKPNETWRIYLVDAEGGVPRLLLADKRNLADPDWSPDGQRLVFGREADMMGKENGPRNLAYLSLTSGRLQDIAGSDNLFSPRWSPGGRWIVALSLDQTRLVLYDVERQTWRTIYHGSAADPVWSADSRSVYFHAFAEPGSPIIRINPETSSSEPVADLTKLGIPAGENYFFSGITPVGSPLIKPSIGTGKLYSVAIPR